MKSEYNPHTNKQVFWCAECDAVQVDSTDKTTGKFYQIFGHAFDDGDYHSVFLAVCPKCQDSFLQKREVI